MNEICRRVWQKGTTIAAWSRENGFNPRYVQAVISKNNVRGKWNAGTALLIKQAMIKDGFMTSEEAGLEE